MGKIKYKFFDAKGQAKRICSSCGNVYPETLEYFYSNCKGGFRPKCKKCYTEQTNKHRQIKAIEISKHPELIGDPTKTKICSKCGDEFPATLEHFFSCPNGKYRLRDKCTECFYIESKINSQKPEAKQRASETGKRWYRKNKDKVSKRWHRYYKENRDWLLKKSEEYRKANLDKARIWDKKRREDPQFRLSSNVSGAIRQSLRDGKAGRHWETLVGYTLKDLVKHIEKQFQPGMTWDNYGEWHLDHVTPKSVFNFKSCKDIDFKRAWALKNLQPLWAADNIRKFNHLDRPFQPSLAFGDAL